MIRRFAAGTAVATGLALSLTGCLGAAKDKAGETGNKIQLTAAQVLGKAADKTGKTDTYKADMTIDTAMSQGSMKMHMTMQTRLRPTLAMAMNVDSMTLGGQSMPGGVGGMEMRLVGDAIYMKSPALSSRNGGKTWSKMSLKSATGSTGLNYDQMLKQAQQQNPATQTKMLTGSKDVREVGSEVIGGVKTTHYTGTISMTEALAKLDPETRQNMAKYQQQLGSGAMAFDVWVDAESLPRKMVNKVKTGMGDVNTTMLFSDYGKPVDIAAPPASEVGEFQMPTLPRS